MIIDAITWNADRILFHLGPVQVRWYGMMFAIGFLIGYKIMKRMFRHEGAPERWLGILLLWIGAGTVVGARLGHCLFYDWSYYSQHPVEILYVWHGGLASHGGTIGCILTILIFSKFTAHRSPVWTFDRIVVPTALVAGLIRLGNLFNSEIYGHATDLPWGFIFVRDGQTVPAHPTQLYEAGVYFLLFALLMWMYWKRNEEERPGLLFGTFMVICFTARFLIEFVKNPQEEFERDMAINMGQLLSIPFILLGIGFIIYAMSRPRLHLKFPNAFPDEEISKAANNDNKSKK